MEMGILQHLRLMSGHVAVDVDGNRQAGNVSGEFFDVDSQGSGLAAKALRTDAEGIDLLQHFLLQLSVERLGVAAVGRTHQSLLCQISSLVEGAADTDANHDGGAGVAGRRRA